MDAINSYYNYIDKYVFFSIAISFRPWNVKNSKNMSMPITVQSDVFRSLVLSKANSPKLKNI